MKLMNLALISATMIVASLNTASAAPLCVSGGTMASYVALGSGGCIIGDMLFSSFVYGSTGHGTGVAVAATNVFVTPTGAGTYNPGPGITISSAGWVVPSASPTTNSFVDSSIAFNVTVLNGSVTLEDAMLTMNSFTQSGTGIVDITETINPSAIQLQVDSSGPFVSHGIYPLVNTVSVLKDVLVTVPKSDSALSGSAQLFSFTENFSEAPEPITPILFGSGLVGLGLWRRRAARN